MKKLITKPVYAVPLIFLTLILTILQFTPPEIIYKTFIQPAVASSITDLSGITGHVGKEDIKWGTGQDSDTFSVPTYSGGTVTLTKLPSLFANAASIIKGKWYVAAMSGDHGNASLTGSLAWVINTLSTDPATIELPGNQTYELTTNLSIPETIVLHFQRGAVLGGTANISGDGLKHIQAGAWQIFSTSGTITFPDGSDLKSSWFADFDTAITKISTAKVRLEITEPDTISNDTTVNKNTSLFSNGPGNILTISSGKTLAINGPFECGLYQAFNGTVLLARGSVVKFPVQWTGSTGDSITDDTDAINSAASIAKTSGVPLLFPPGDYLVTESINATVSAYEGLIIEGAGRNVSVITANLSEAYAVFDLTGSHEATVRHLSISGSAAGSQSCAILSAQAVSNSRGQRAKLYDLLIDGTYSKAGVVFASSDVSKVDKCDILGPTAIVAALSDYLSIGSKFETISTSAGMTKISLTDSSFRSTTRASVIFEGIRLNAKGCFFSLENNAVSGIEIVNSSFSAKMDLFGCRSESSSATDPTYLVRLTTNQGLTDAFISGDYDVTTGPYIYLENSGMDNAILMARLSDVTPSLVGNGAGSSVFNNCIIMNYQDVKPDADTVGNDNLIIQKTWAGGDASYGTHNLVLTRDGTHNTGWMFNRLSSITATTAFADGFPGQLLNDPFTGSTTATTDEEVLGTYSIPGALSPTANRRTIFKVMAWGDTAANANAKTIRGKFAGTTVVTNDITANPNNTEWLLEMTLSYYTDSPTKFECVGKMYIGNVLQTVNFERIAADPVSNPAIEITGQNGVASANDIVCESLLVSAY